jgi:hypothetical protein
MAWTTPGTAVAGDVLTAARWNSDVRDNTTSLFKPPACFIYRTSADTAQNATWLRPTFDAELYDTDSMHDLSTNTQRITFNTAGIYVISAGIYFENNSTSGERILCLSKNASNADPQTATAGVNVGTQYINTGEAYMRMSLTTIHRFNVADFMTMHLFQNHGAAMIVGATTSASSGFLTAPTGLTPAFHMSATWIGNPA